MSSLQTFADYIPDHAWRWRSADGDLWLPAEMETRHSFYTFRMIWNHSVPENMRVGHNVRMYSFGEFYTRRYMKMAVLHIGRELSKRKDLKPWQFRELMQIASYFRDDLFEEVRMVRGPRPLLTAPA